MNRVLATIAWGLVALIAAGSLAVLALSQGETVNAAWLVAAAIGSFLIGYRFYSRFIAERVLRLDAARPTPALRRADGMDYVATDRRVLFGHHFAAIAGAGPLIGPVLAAQMGYLPGTLWIIAGVILAGAVQDFTVLLLSLRRDGRSLGEMIRSELGAAAGITAMIGILAIMIILLAVLALVVVKALAISPLGQLHRRRHHPDRRADGHLSALAAARARAGGLAARSRPAARRGLARRPGRRRSRLGGRLHARCADPGLSPDRLRLRRRRPAGVAAAGAA
jgi:Carbon starvation protein, predicted membrane protein